MLVPYKANVHVDLEPRANVVLLLTMALIHIMGWLIGSDAFAFMVLSRHNVLAGLVLSPFLHLGIFHLVGNGLFLWVFGNAINCRLGNVRYLIVFFALAIVSGSVHLLVDGRSAAGASGAVSGIVGMFLLLFPRNSIKCFWLISFFGGRTEIPAFYLIGFWFLLDLVGAIMGTGNVAYVAHLAGTISGFLLAIALVKMRLITFWMTDKPLIDV